MKKIFFLIVIFILICNNQTFSHNQHVHQYIIREAYKLLKLQLGYDIPMIKDHIGYTEGYAGNGPWTTGLITAGGWREDQEDPIYHYSQNSPPPIQGGGIWYFLNLITTDEPFVSTTHFWKADNGDNLITDLAGYIDNLNHDFLMTVPNAYQKSKNYSDGMWILSYYIPTNGYLRVQKPNGRWLHLKPFFPPGPVYIYYSDLIDLYKNKRIYTTLQNGLYQMEDEITGQNEAYTGSVFLTDEMRNFFAYEIIGRMCHLLADMSVPTHAHNDMHGMENTGIRIDPYEAYFGYNYGWDANTTYINSGGYINPYQSSNPLHFLMYTLNQISDHFNSNGPINQDGNNTIGGNYSTTEYNYLVDMNLSSLGEPQGNNFDFNNTNILNIRDKLMPLAIRYTAGLLYWFATETNLIPLAVPSNYTTIQQAVSAATAGKTILVTSGTQTLNSNITIPEGVNIIFQSGVTVNLNGYYLKTNGNNFTDEGAVWTPNNFLLKQGTTFLGYYSSIAQALTFSTSGQTVSVENGSHTVSSLLIIPSGVTLQLNSGVSIAFNGGLTVNGGFVTNGASLIFGSGTGMTVNGSANCNYTTFTGSGWNGITVNNSPNGYFDHCNISGGIYGVNVYGGYSAIRYCRINNTTYGSYFSNYASGDMSTCVYDENYDAVKGDASSVPSPGGTIAGYISFRTSGHFDVHSAYSGTINACGNYWESQTITTNVNAANPLSSDPNPRLSGKTPENIETPMFKKSSISKVSSEDDGIKLLDNARLLLETKNYDAALNSFKTITDNYSDKLAGRMALVFTENILNKTGKSSEVLNTLGTYEAKKSSISPFAAYRKGYVCLRNGEYEKALDIMKNTTFAKDDIEMEKVRLLDLGIINYDCLDKKSEGLNYFNELVTKYPEDRLSEMACTFYGVKKGIKPEDKKIINNETIKETALFSNYPNPFNPSTIIKFNLAENTNVTLKVYDVLGREVKTLVNDFKAKGAYEVKFDGNGLASGLYFYQLKAGNVNQIMKMVLTK